MNGISHTMFHFWFNGSVNADIFLQTYVYTRVSFSFSWEIVLMHEIVVAVRLQRCSL